MESGSKDLGRALGTDNAHVAAVDILYEGESQHKDGAGADNDGFAFHADPRLTEIPLPGTCETPTYLLA
jgi:hypothetical protein